MTRLPDTATQPATHRVPAGVASSLGCGAADLYAPWKVEEADGECAVVSEAQPSIIMAVVGLAGYPAPEARARLIASAPELYAALAEWVELVTPTLLQALAAGYPNERHMDLLGRSNIALVKARGELE